jgi:MoaA/NifB/PqqE/SkfB family radical SAM enzyme
MTIKYRSQGILHGSSHLSSGKIAYDRNMFMVEHMSKNAAYQFYLEQYNNDAEKALAFCQKKYKEYRRLWKEQLFECADQGISGDGMVASGFRPLCVDIEVASICDLACKFCYRETLATPDKIMSMDLFKNIADQVSALGVPSVKLNWRGEPLMNPRLPEMIHYLKKSGVLEVIINTNATHLTEEVSRRLIESGLDYMIFSFDGGTKETYEKLRVGRFKKNEFNGVYNNILNFSKIRKELGYIYPRTKIQMILTEDTVNEQEDFYSNFNNIVDEVTVTPYTERGGEVDKLTIEEKSVYLKKIEKYSLEYGTPYLRNTFGDIFVTTGRLACAQPFQRQMITYDGRVAMCCYDWGAMHPIGYVSNDCFSDDQKNYKEILSKIAKGKNGYRSYTITKLPPKFNEPPKVINNLREIWEGKEVDKVRKCHIEGNLHSVNICEKCPFQDTYEWK